MSAKIGRVSQIIGPVIDVTFNEQGAELPNIYDALEITRDNGQKVILECQQHVGEDTVRAIAMDASDGLRRGMEVVNTGMPIKMPIGEEINGRLFNVVGDTIDGIGDISKDELARAIERLKENAGFFSKNELEIVLINSWYSELRKEIIKGVISFEEKAIRQNRIILRILELLDKEGEY